MGHVHSLAVPPADTITPGVLCGEAMRGLLFAVLFCAVSLLFAETLATILVDLAIIQQHEFDEVHSLIMFIMLALYLGFGPTFSKDFRQHHHDDDTNNDKKPS
ncbi:MAG: hypothetical protein OQL08_05710 [Gammaproteobacteria bacterium]|nr:hypothetical protein [Gammaproteobacteria bacterium]